MGLGKFGFGVVGIGNIVQGTIAPALVAEEGCELVAAVSRDQRRADAFAEKFGARLAYTDYDEMLANSEVDAVFMATPNEQHSAQTIAAARAGKHVMCDKPMATNVADAKSSVAACEAAGIRLGINFHNRHLPWVRDTRAMVAEGCIGDIEVIQSRRRLRSAPLRQLARGPRHGRVGHPLQRRSPHSRLPRLDTRL